MIVQKYMFLLLHDTVFHYKIADHSDHLFTLDHSFFVVLLYYTHSRSNPIPTKNLSTINCKDPFLVQVLTSNTGSRA